MTGTCQAWRACLIRHIAEQEEQHRYFHSFVHGASSPLETWAREANATQMRLSALATRALLLPPHPIPATPPVYAHVLSLLRAADKDGGWPTTSKQRRKVIRSSSGGASVGEGASTASEGGDSFSGGAMPPGYHTPVANTTHRELLDAAFALEAAIAPHRQPSSTVAVNRHAAFLPHKDSGAGAGQTVSLIVALGDFVGGELVVEGQVHDVRYLPLEFDGWAERHWTAPFAGERFSLVFFTPLGCSNSFIKGL